MIMFHIHGSGGVGWEVVIMTIELLNKISQHLVVAFLNPSQDSCGPIPTINNTLTLIMIPFN